MPRWSHSRGSSHRCVPRNRLRDGIRSRFCDASRLCHFCRPYHRTDGFCWFWADRRASPWMIFVDCCFCEAQAHATHPRPPISCSIVSSCRRVRSDNSRWTSRDWLPELGSRCPRSRHCRDRRLSSGSTMDAHSWVCPTCYSLLAHISSTLFILLVLFFVFFVFLFFLGTPKIPPKKPFTDQSISQRVAAWLFVRIFPRNRFGFQWKLSSITLLGFLVKEGRKASHTRVVSRLFFIPRTAFPIKSLIASLSELFFK